MKLSQLVLFSCLMFIFSCKKPRKGVYDASFIDSSSSYNNSLRCSVDRGKSKISFGNLNSQDSHINISGELQLGKDSATGELKYSYSGLGTSYLYTYTLKGKTKREEIKGTYTCVNSGWSGCGGSSTSNSSGNFEIKFYSRKNP